MNPALICPATSATVAGECGMNTVELPFETPMSFSMSKYCVIIIISMTSLELMSVTSRSKFSTCMPTTAASEHRQGSRHGDLAIVNRLAVLTVCLAIVNEAPLRESTGKYCQETNTSKNTMYIYSLG